MKKKNTTEQNWKGRARKSWWKILILAIFVTAVLIVSSSYLDFKLPLMPSRLSKAVDIAIASLPFVPKTNKQLLEAAIYKNSQITSAEENLEINLRKEEGKQSFDIYTLTLNGSFDTSVEAEQFATKLSGRIGPENSKLTTKAAIREEDKSFYFQLDSAVPLGINLKSSPNDWYKVDIDEVEKKIKAEAKTDNEIKEDIKKFFSDSISESAFSAKLRKASQDQVKVDGVRYYKITLNLDERQVKEVFHSSGLFKKTQLVFFIHKDDLFLSRVDFKTDPTTSLLGALPIVSSLVSDASGLKLSGSFKLDKINQAQKFSLPDTSKGTIKERDLFSLYEETAGVKLDDPFALLQASKQLSDFGANILTIEKLAHVWLLTPSAL